MFWILITYVLFASAFAFWIGRPIIWLSFNNEKFNAAFRYALVRLRDASEAVAFYSGEIAERTGQHETEPHRPSRGAQFAREPRDADQSGRNEHRGQRSHAHARARTGPHPWRRG